MLASAASTLVVIFMPMTSSVTVLLTLLALDGAIAGMMWPPITGWLSLGQEGHYLNRRLGVFSFSWGSGATVGMWLGGPLWGPSCNPYLYPAFAVASCVSIGAFIIAASARKQRLPSVTPRPVETTEAIEAEANNVSVFHWIAVIAGAIVGVTNGVIRYPIVSLMKSMSLGPDVHGQIAAAITITLTCGLFLMGRTTRWHYKQIFFWSVQLVMAAAVCAVAFSRNGWDLAVYSVIASLGMAVIFASDLYYSLTCSTRRAASMSWREIRVSIGFAIGSFGGGALSPLSTGSRSTGPPCGRSISSRRGS